MCGWNPTASSAASWEADVADVDFMGFAYRHVAVNPAFQELRLWQTLSNFGGLDYYVMGRLYDKEDKSAYPRVQKVFRYSAAHEDVCYGVSSKADTLLVRETYVIPNPEERGWIRALTESHILFDETLSGGLAKIDLGKYKTIILPEKQRLAPAALEKLMAWVQQGVLLIPALYLMHDFFGLTGIAAAHTAADFGAILAASVLGLRGYRQIAAADNLINTSWKCDSF